MLDELVADVGKSRVGLLCARTEVGVFGSCLTMTVLSEELA